MTDHDLDDLVFNTEPTKSHAKTKNPLTLFALVIIILILGIVFSKNFHQDTDNSELLEENMSDFIAPELKLQETPSNKIENNNDETEMVAPPQKPKETEENSNEPSLQSFIEKRAKSPLDNMQVIEMPIPRMQRTATEERVETPKEKPVKEEIVKTIDESPKQETSKVEEKQVEEPIEKATPPVIEKPIEKAPVIKKPKPKPTPPPRIEKSNEKAYYIQVGSFRQTPSKRLLSVITATGFNHELTSPNRSGIKKLLIGPYSSQSSVNKALNTVKVRINKSAFVIRK